MWGAEAESFSRAVVDEVAGVLHVVLGDVGERGAFLEVLPQEAVGVLDGAFLPRVVRASEIAICFKDSGDDAVAGELAAVVEGDGLYDVLERQQLVYYGWADDVRLEGRHEFGPQETCLSFRHGDEVSRAAAPDDCIRLDVS